MFLVKFKLSITTSIPIICQGISGRRPSFLAIHAKLAKKNTSTFWGFEPGTNFLKKFEPGTIFCGRNRWGQATRPPTSPVSGHFFYILQARSASREGEARAHLLPRPGRARLPRPLGLRSAAPTS